MAFKSAWGIVKESGQEFSQDRALRLAAATAYYAVFSIGPLLVLVAGVAGLVWGQTRVHQAVQEQLTSYLGADSAGMIGKLMQGQKPGGSLVATIAGGVALVLGATGVFGQIQDALNTIWGVVTKPGQSIWALLRDRLFSMAMVLGVGFLLLVSMALSAIVNTFANALGQMLSVPGWAIPLFNGVASFLVITLLFALIFKLLPDVKIRWRDVWVGALATAALFTVGKYLLGLYLAHETEASAYGAGTAFVGILLYVYYSSVILYFGAEMTQVFACRRGFRLEPGKYAVLMTDTQRIQQGIPEQRQVEEAARRADGGSRPAGPGPSTVPGTETSSPEKPEE